jgi:hypothetical protein
MRLQPNQLKKQWLIGGVAASCYTPLRRRDKRARQAGAGRSYCLSNIRQILLGLISTETVNSTVKIACEGRKAVIRLLLYMLPCTF